MERNTYEVTNICDSLSTASVVLEDNAGQHCERTIDVPLSRLELINKQVCYGALCSRPGRGRGRERHLNRKWSGVFCSDLT